MRRLDQIGLRVAAASFAILELVEVAGRFSVVRFAATVCFVRYAARSCDFTRASALGATTSAATTTMLLTLAELAQQF
jgi:hypothetical protein